VRRRGDDGSWEDEEFLEGLGATLELPEISVHLAMAEIYEDTDLARAAASAG
jgi:hypothetical protein